MIKVDTGLSNAYIRSIWKFTFIPICSMLFWSGCGSKNEVKEIKEVKIRSASDRSGTRQIPPSGFSAPNRTRRQPFQWDLPEGWSVLPLSGMRIVDLRVAGSTDTSCYVTALSGDGGGVPANINLWRSQMILPALTPEEIEQLP